MIFVLVIFFFLIGHSKTKNSEKWPIKEVNQNIYILQGRKPIFFLQGTNSKMTYITGDKMLLTQN